MNKIFDISITISDQLPVWPGEKAVEIVQTSSIGRGDECNVSYFTMGMHAGTHIDTPLHFVKGGSSTSEVDLQKFMGKAKVFKLEIDNEVQVDDLEELSIYEGDIILLSIEKNNELLKDGIFHEDYVAISTGAAKYLVDKRIKGVGINCCSIEKFGEPGHVTHHILLENDVVVYEGLNLENIEAGEYQFYCLPLKIEDGNGSPARAILIR